MSNKRRFYVTTAIPYVNGDPHLGHALELVQADVLARHRRLRGDDVRFLSGTDDNALKNVDAALAAGRPVAEFVAEKAQRFVDLTGPLQLSNDDFIRTSTDPRHPPGVERLWRACAETGDLYQRDYEGFYCSGCEAFVSPGDLTDGLCPEHGEAPELIAERNWFFRLSRHQDALLDLIERGSLRIEPEHRRNEVLAFIRSGLTDFSVSRAQERARGWGIPVPGDPEQVIYVWFDALANYISALGGGSDGQDYREWWSTSDERLHVIGKGIIRFHAIYWPAILLSAGRPLPTTIFVHDYLTVEGQKLSKSLGTTIDPLWAIVRYGADALRWWFLRDGPRNGDADFREELLAARAKARRRTRQPDQPDDRARRPQPAGGGSPDLRLARRSRGGPHAVQRASVWDRHGARGVRPTGGDGRALGGCRGGQPLRLGDAAVGPCEGRTPRGSAGLRATRRCPDRPARLLPRHQRRTAAVPAGRGRANHQGPHRTRRAAGPDAVPQVRAVA
jgi:methionyl-tRNA synthetase